MPCHNCGCAECAKDRAKPDGWHGSLLWHNGEAVAMIVPLVAGFQVWVGDPIGIYPTREAAQQAAEAATLPLLVVNSKGE